MIGEVFPPSLDLYEPELVAPHKHSHSSVRHSGVRARMVELAKICMLAKGTGEWPPGTLIPLIEVHLGYTGL